MAGAAKTGLWERLIQIITVFLVQARILIIFLVVEMLINHKFNEISSELRVSDALCEIVLHKCGQIARDRIQCG